MTKKLPSKLKVGDTGTIYLKKHKINRTPSQNNALHLWFELVAEELNNAGYTVQIILKDGVAYVI